MPIHSAAAGPLITSAGVGRMAALRDDEAEVEGLTLDRRRWPSSGPHVHVAPSGRRELDAHVGRRAGRSPRLA